MSDQFVGEIRIFPFDFTPPGWAWCNGQILSVAQNTTLFSIIPFTYGGNGVTTFALPDLRGRAPMQPGQGTGFLSNRVLGEKDGESAVTLQKPQLPGHTHTVYASQSPPTTQSPEGAVWSATATGRSPAYGPVAGNPPIVSMHEDALSIAGGGQPHNNMQPYMTLNFCIAMEGIYPDRQ